MADNNFSSTLLKFVSGPRLAFLAFAVVGGYFLWTEHRAHVVQALPYLILLLCPLMHIFMHGGHGGHGGHGRNDGNDGQSGHGGHRRDDDNNRDTQ